MLGSYFASRLLGMAGLLTFEPRAHVSPAFDLGFIDAPSHSRGPADRRSRNPRPRRRLRANRLYISRRTRRRHRRRR